MLISQLFLINKYQKMQMALNIRICKPIVINQVIKRTMLSRFQVINKVFNDVVTPPNTLINPMSIAVVRKPQLIGDSAESYKNNPICTVNRGFGQIPVRHPEIVQQCCIIRGCNKTIYSTLCAKPIENNAQAIAHATHGNPPGAIPFNTCDLSNNPIPENLVVYTTPHSIIEIENTIQENKTENLQKTARRQVLENILRNYDNEE